MKQILHFHFSFPLEYETIALDLTNKSLNMLFTLAISFLTFEMNNCEYWIFKESLSRCVLFGLLESFTELLRVTFVKNTF